MWARPSFAERMLAREIERQREQERMAREAYWDKRLTHIRGFTELAVWFALLYALWPFWLWEIYKDPWQAVNVYERLKDMLENP